VVKGDAAAITSVFAEQVQYYYFMQFGQEGSSFAFALRSDGA